MSTKTKVLENGNNAIQNREIENVAGFKAARIFGELINSEDYFMNNGMLNEDGFFYVTIDYLEKQTGIKRTAQKNALDKLEELGFIETKLKGMPRKKYIKILKTTVDPIDTTVNTTFDDFLAAYDKYMEETLIVDMAQAHEELLKLGFVSDGSTSGRPVSAEELLELAKKERASAHPACVIECTPDASFEHVTECIEHETRSKNACDTRIARTPDALNNNINKNKLNNNTIYNSDSINTDTVPGTPVPTDSHTSSVNTESLNTPVVDTLIEKEDHKAYVRVDENLTNESENVCGGASEAGAAVTDYAADINKVFEYFKEKLGRNISLTEVMATTVSKLFSSNHTVDELKMVVDDVLNWDAKFQSVRFETLFGEKFESYLSRAKASKQKFNQSSSNSAFPEQYKEREENKPADPLAAYWAAREKAFDEGILTGKREIEPLQLEKVMVDGVLMTIF